MAAKTNTFKCLIHFNGQQRGTIVSNYCTFSKLHETVIQKFKLEKDVDLNFSFQLSSFDSPVEITDDDEVNFFFQCGINSIDEFAHSFVSEKKKVQRGQFFDFFKTPTLQNEDSTKDKIKSSHLNNIFSNDTSFGFQSQDQQFLKFQYSSNETNDLNDGRFPNHPSSSANEENFNKYRNFMSFQPDIPETPLYIPKKINPNDYTQQSDVEKDKSFGSKQDLIMAVRRKAVKEGFQFRTDVSDPCRVHLKCDKFNECSWYLRGRLLDNGPEFYISYLNDVHTCSRTQTFTNHRNANKKNQWEYLTPKLQDRSRTLIGKDIQNDMLHEHHIHISYQQAMRGKHYSIELIRGSPYEAFEMLPYYCYNLELKNEGTVTRIKTDEKGVFEVLFIAIGASIRTYKNCLRPLLVIDVAHMKGLYKGTNLVAVGMDGNNQIVPIAFGICKGETGPCWSWWLFVLKECIPDDQNLLFISDRHPAIAMGIRDEYPLSFHAICGHHLLGNLGLKNKKRKATFWKTCKSYTREDFEDGMRKLQNAQVEAHQKLVIADPRRWARAHCPLVGYNYMTSNSVESVNALSVLTRREPVLKLAETYRAMVQRWYFERRKTSAEMKYELTDWASHKVQKKKLKSVTWVVTGVNKTQYNVDDGQYVREVDLRIGTCGCRKWQLSGLPCGHVIAVTRFLGLTDCIEYASDWFKKPKYQATYLESIHSLGNMQQWKFPEHLQKAIPPRMDNPQAGRPPNTNRILSQGEEPQIPECTRCHQRGHKRNACDQPFVFQPPNKQTQNAHPFPQTYNQYTTPQFNNNHHTNEPYFKTPSQPNNQYFATTSGQPLFGQATEVSDMHEHYNHEQYDDAQPYDQHFATTSTQALFGHNTESSQVNDQYNSQDYDAQHLENINSNSTFMFGFNPFGF